MANKHNYSIMPPSGVFGDKWPRATHESVGTYGNTIPQGIWGQLSMAGWTSGTMDGTPSSNGNEGYPQQTFLGASIRSFNVQAGFGDSSSTMGIELVNDEFNKSDYKGFGDGDDVYHNGVHDKFMPPVVGAPVFFKFGKNFATTEQAFRKDLDQIYDYDTLEVPADPFPVVTKPLPIAEHPAGHYLMEKDQGQQTAKWIDKSILLDISTKWRGFAHFTFGGILQSYTENRSQNGNPLYSVKLVDPREILSNTEMLFNNYKGTTFNNKNLFNIYGFLEYDPSDQLIFQFEKWKKDIITDKSVLTKYIDSVGNVSYSGVDEYSFKDETSPDPLTGEYPEAVIEVVSEYPLERLDGTLWPPETGKVSGVFPITGQGFSRRSENGMPWYRVRQAMRSLFSYDSDLPKEYREAGFGGTIDFRGYNYVVDWGGIPVDDIPKTYYLDFDKLNMMDLAQELCDVLSRELFVSLLPVIEHPACQFLYEKNLKVLEEAKTYAPDDPARDLVLGSGLVAGIIRIDSIDKKKQPKYGTVKKYLDSLASHDIFVESRDVGFEVSNVVTDKFVVGAQEVDMYYFNTLRDRDNYLDRLMDTGDAKAKQRLEQLGHDKWTLETNMNQQVLPFYGFIGDKAVTIPRGFGSYQQILLDARGLDAHGVGSYYIATEMELRAASVSYKAWQNFLLTYNEVYIQELSENQAFFAELGMNMTQEVEGINDQIDANGEIKKQLDVLTDAGRRFGVSVPRSVWNSDKSPRKTFEPVLDEDGEQKKDEDGEDVVTEKGGPFEGLMNGLQTNPGEDGYPASPCNPPFGYPLYYKRAEKIGIPQAGLTKITGSIQTVITNMENLENQQRSDKQRFSYVNSMAEASIRRLEALIKQLEETKAKGTEAQKNYEIDLDISILKDRIIKIKENIVIERDEIKTLREHRKVQIMQLKSTIKNSAGIIKNISRTQRDSLNNAKRVYNFVKKIADDNLGKKFLVKIPRGSNVNWSAKIKNNKGRAWDVVRGPFGFPPQPVNSKPGWQEGVAWKEMLRDFKEVAKVTEREGPTPNVLDGSVWPTKSNIHWHYLDVHSMGQSAHQKNDDNLTHFGSGYTDGALKCNFNPMSEKWEHNYKPEPQGGFFNYALFDKNLKAEELEENGVSNTKLSEVNKNVLAPILMDKIIANGNRVQCYVRYDHSQHLDFSNINADSVEQQGIGAAGKFGFKSFIPDVMEMLPNLHPDKRESINQIQARLSDDKDLERQEESVAFVKCDIDEQFYMAPKTTAGDAVVWAEDFTVNLAPTPYEVIYVPSGDDGCKVPMEVKRRPIISFGVKDGGLLSEKGLPTVEEIVQEDDSTVTVEVDVTTETAHKEKWDDFERSYSETYKGWIIETKEKDLDPEHVYALITVPGRVMPTIDKRYVDGPMKSLNGVSIANAMTEDVVKIDEFSKPGIAKPKDAIVNCDFLPEGVDFNFEDLSRAVEAQKKAAQGISLSNNGDNSLLAFTSPSPIYPDLVALPLMSMERCYGPWVSSALDGEMLGLGDIRFSEIGGKIDFVKEEGLAPWSFAGYQLMDEAARMKTKFSNSLMLLSERGSFSYASIPIEVPLAKALADPATIHLLPGPDKDRGPLVTSISVDVGQSIRTTVKLDLYTSQFGKLQKQKELAIAQIGRERQKIIDQNNLLTRRGIGKGAANMNMLGTLMEKGGQKLLDAAKASNDIFTALEKGDVEKASMITISATNDTQTFDNVDNDLTTGIVSEGSEGVLQSESQVTEMASLIRDERDFDKKMEQTAGDNIAGLYVGISDDPHNPYFASRRMNVQSQKNRRTWG